jgi:hypothetical protein
LQHYWGCWASQHCLAENAHQSLGCWAIALCLLEGVQSLGFRGLGFKV